MFTFCLAFCFLFRVFSDMETSNDESFYALKKYFKGKYSGIIFYEIRNKLTTFFNKFNFYLVSNHISAKGKQKD